MPRVGVGGEETRLVILRGNSASGKSSVAAGVRDRFGRGLALVGQDNVRRVVLREHDVPGGANIGLIDTIARYALDAGYHVVVEGILYADRYGDMLAGLLGDHRGVSRCYYLDVPIEETLIRHASKTDHEYLIRVTERELRTWYRERDLLPGGPETVIGADNTLNATIDLVMNDTGLAGLPPRVDRPRSPSVTVDHTALPVEPHDGGPRR
ncbi:kinase [Streptomyces sp. NPDC057939]|uniref:kinase n=1 Tax=Streptomyces sp. NPDC057939 TaxID=3346284 RepID=UPI0036EFE667